MADGKPETWLQWFAVEKPIKTNIRGKEEMFLNFTAREQI